eukprot:CAMPEP_0202746162 /NCGR_PEP_ID=MMETSP1388-20130828/7927_1 /ASSEMBLY_ACC=CAM_ASM_000864 /TAXON_ID=37098 /ORGANISM="Isochrysis sp, Strain CCMP1244" /LENGTH=43 /DNA_ID= /DNA_START= /DNA_END= /DNA_ORIENTATION=
MTSKESGHCSSGGTSLPAAGSGGRAASCSTEPDASSAPRLASS